jgi:molecular chaperone GrpE (heat shock protein)
MDKRSAILAERERIRIEKEQRKQRKIEIKRRRLIKEKRDTLKRSIEEIALSKVDNVDSVFAASIVEGISEAAVKPYLSLMTDVL